MKGNYISPLPSPGLKPLICNGFHRSNCPRWRPCAAARFQSFAADGFWPHRPDNTFPDWSGDRKLLRTGSKICRPSYKKAPFPIPYPAAGPQFGNICRPTIWKCFGRRCGRPIHHPRADNFHCRCCSTHVPVFEPGEIVGNPNGVNLTFRYPFSRFVKKGGLLPAQTAQ